MSESTIPWGPTGEIVYERTYSRKKPDGTNETWPDTSERVVDGNLSLVYGDKATWSEAVHYERERLLKFMHRFAILPAGRHLWASGVKGRQYLFNCHVAGWGVELSRHFEFTFMRLMEGGGVGSNYSSTHLAPYGAPRRQLNVHIVCDPNHPDYEELRPYLSSQYDADWAGSFEVEDSREGWSVALVDLIDTFMTDDEVKHENRVYDVSRVRARGSRLKTFGGTASGPAPFAAMMVKIGRILSEASVTRQHTALEAGGRPLGPQVSPLDAMEMDHAIAECVVSGGNRRSARMSMLHWRDPAIWEFLACKEDRSRHWTTNISVIVDNEFHEALADVDHPLHEHARAVHIEVTRRQLTDGEPGYWDIDASNVGEPNPVIATNPCGEIALREWENCNLGHINLDAFAPTRKGGPADMLGLIEAHRLMTRFLIRATFGDVTDAEQGTVLAANRRIGVGHLGVQGFWAKRGVRYSELPASGQGHRFLKELYRYVREEARAYAFELRIPEPVKVTTMAPTGSIAKLPGVPEGGHSIYGRFFNRRVRFSYADPDQARQVDGFFAQGFHVEPCVYDQSGNTMVVTFPTKDTLVEQVEALGYPADMVESADEIALADMLAFQAMYQEAWADNAVSFTVNVPAEPHQDEALLAGADVVPAPSARRVAEVAATVARFLPLLKGTTIMLDGSRPQAPYERITAAEYEAAAAKLVADGTDEDCANGACPVR